MPKTIIAAAAALIAGTALADTANAGVRVGFGFPLGSFVAHENSGGGGGYGRDCERPRRYQSARPAYNPRPQRTYKAPVVAQPKYVAPPPVAQARPSIPADKQVGKLDNKVTDAAKNETNVTEIAKTATDDIASNDLTAVSTTAILAKAPDGATKNGNSTLNKDVTALPEVVVESKPKVATAVKTDGKKSDLKQIAATSADKKVCRRFSAAIGGLVETACE